MTETKENLIEYYNVLNPDEIINDDMSYEELFYKTHGITYDQYLRETEELEKRTHKINYENIPQRKLLLKKDNIKTVTGVFHNELNKFQTVVQSKKGKRIMILNFYVDGVDIYCLINENGVKIIRDDKNNIKVSFSIKIPTRFEIEFFSVAPAGADSVIRLKMIHQPIIHLRLVKEMEKSEERIGNNLYEITEKTKRNLNM